MTGHGFYARFAVAIDAPLASPPRLTGGSAKIEPQVPNTELDAYFLFAMAGSIRLKATRTMMIGPKTHACCLSATSCRSESTSPSNTVAEQIIDVSLCATELNEQRIKYLRKIRTSITTQI